MTAIDPLDARALEDASDGLARLDAAVTAAPGAFASALWFSAISALADAGPKGTRALVIAFASGADQLLEPPAQHLEHWRAFLEIEERRARSGAPLSAGRLLRAPGSSQRAEAGRSVEANESAVSSIDPTFSLDSALRPEGSGSRSAALFRAAAVAAAIPDRAVGEAAAALVLVADGRTDRLRLLPFGGVTYEDWARAVQGTVIDAATADAWRSIAFPALTRACRLKTRALARSTEAMAAEDSALDTLGRAAITARRALALLRTDLAGTVLWLAAELGVSRPAAGDALERLAAAGLATEITGRKRDRVFAYTTALAVADA